MHSMLFVGCIVDNMGGLTIWPADYFHATNACFRQFPHVNEMHVI